jgi:hypothetical protein
VTTPDTAQTTRTNFDGVLLTIRSRKSFFEVTQAIERALPRFHIPKLMKYVTHGDRAGVEAYVDATSRPFSIFWDFVVPVLPGQVLDEGNLWWRRLAVRRP